MSKLFGIPHYDEHGEMILSTYENAYKAMKMDVRVYKMAQGESREFTSPNEEIAVLLLSGKALFKCEKIEQKVSRKDVFSQGPWCLHLPREERIIVKAQSDLEILVQKAENHQFFIPRLYTPEDAPWNYSAVGKFGNVAKRRVNTIFDLENAPYSNMVLGEVLNDRGNWSGYLPHQHPQPELYYFLFDRPEGFGASFIGDDVFKSVHQSFAAIPGGMTHPQAVAPGFQMYTTWMIRHLPDKPWRQTDRNEDERYQWLHDATF